MSALVEAAGETLSIRFAPPWDADSYALFLRTKALPEHEVRYDEDADTYTVETPSRFARILGMETPAIERGMLPLASHLWDYQAFLVDMALQAKRYAVWADTGLGKTSIEWEWARQVQHRTCGKVLGLYLLPLLPQALEMARGWYGKAFADAIKVLETRDALISWCKGGGPGIAVTNPEKFIPRDDREVIPEIAHLAGMFIDESSLLKTGGGAIKWALIKSCRGIEFKLSLTATPAPNDPIEYASQASWLEKIRDEGEVIWTYFVRDSEGEWKVKDHALADFYRFLSGWSCYLRTPARYGFRDNLKDLPAPERIVHRIEATAEQRQYFTTIPDAEGQTSLVDRAKLDMVTRAKLGEVSSGFIYEAGKARAVQSYKPSAIARIVREEVRARRQVIVWTQYDATADIVRDVLALQLPGDPALRIAVLTGAVPLEARPAILDAFKAGAFDVLVTRLKLLAFGQNLQNATAHVFADLTDSYEQIYQGERRSYRYGQTRSVRFHFPIVEELQGVVFQNVEAKRARFEHDVDRMERLYVEAMRDLLPRRCA
jgi:hypothetical protein